MTFLYIEPYPGNGIGLLGEIYAALQDHGKTNKYQVEVAGYGYPPIYIDLTSKPVSRADIEKLVKDTVQKVLDREKSNLKISLENAENVLFVENIHWLTHFDEQGKRDKNPHPPHEKKDKENEPTRDDGKAPKFEFDVFLAHNAKDQPEVEQIGIKLEACGLKPWLDKKQIPPGRWFLEVIQQAIPTVKAVAIFIGTHGLGRWEKVELNAFLAEAVNRHIPVIPVLLPGVEDIPSDQILLKQLKWIKFPSIEDKYALEKLVWGITHDKPDEDKQGRPEKPSVNEPKENGMDKNTLTKILVNFTEPELKDLCADLESSYKDIEGDDKRTRVRNLITFFVNREEFQKLVDTAKKNKPNLFS